MPNSPEQINPAIPLVLDPTVCLTTDEARALLRCNKSWLYAKLAEGTIPSITIGRRRRIRKIDLLQLIGKGAL